MATRFLIYRPEFEDQVVDLIVAIQQDEFGISITAEDQPDLSDIADFYQQGGGNFWIALDNDQVVGTLALLDIGHGRGALRKMFVHKDYRGPEKATAHQLLQRLVAWAKQQNMSEIYLGTTAKFLAAHRFYEKNGFEPISKAALPASFPVMEVDTRFYKMDLGG